MGIEASRILSFSRAYASTRPAMILLGGSSMHKGANGWHTARAIRFLPLQLRQSVILAISRPTEPRSVGGM